MSITLLRQGEIELMPCTVPDPEQMNDDRAAWALHALLAFVDLTNVEADDALADLLSDLMHLSDRARADTDRDDAFDFEACLARARSNYQAETLAQPNTGGSL